MNTLISLFFTIFLLFNVVASAPLVTSPRDVFVPPVLYPNTSTVWKVGSTHSVKWDTTNAPASITNRNGVIVLKKLDGKLDVEHPIAKNFDILDGAVTITVPDVQPGKTYKLVLFGDSGNDSQAFEITV